MEARRKTHIDRLTADRVEIQEIRDRSLTEEGLLHDLAPQGQDELLEG